MTASPHQTAIVVFARGAEAEAKGLLPGSKPAARLSELLLRQTLRTIGQVPGPADLVLAIDGRLPERCCALLPTDRGLHVLEQRGSDFESRLLDSLKRVRDLGYRRLVLVGIDTPSMSARDLQKACETSGLVVGPSEDGGFYLLGLDAHQLERLQGLPWCTARLSSALRRRFAGLSIHERPLRADLDRPGDVFRQRARLNRLALRLLGVLLDGVSPPPIFGVVSEPRTWRVQSRRAARGPPRLAPNA